MDLLPHIVATLSQICQHHLNEISLAIVVTLIVLFGAKFGLYLQRLVGHFHIVFRVLIIACLYLIVFGLVINYLPPLLKHLLHSLNNYSLFPVLLIILIIIGIIADKR